jgi:hypothetical protein
MMVEELGLLFNRAFNKVWNKESLLGTWLVLLICAWLVVFFHGLSLQTNAWIALAVNNVPLFISVGILLAWGIVLVRRYHNQLKNTDKSTLEVVKSSWRLLGLGLNFSLPILLGFIALWVALGIFVLMSSIPLLGEFFSVIFSFIPFLLIVSVAILFIASFLILYIAAPLLALTADELEISYKTKAKERLLADPYTNIQLAIVAALPTIISLIIFCWAYQGTLQFLPSHDSVVYSILEGCMLAIPFTALLTPSVILFFNLAAEAHVYVLKRAKAAS